MLRADPAGATAAKFELGGQAKRFTAELHTLAGTGEHCPEAGLRFDVAVDEQIVLRCAVVPPASSPLPIDIDLTGHQTLSLILNGDRGGAGCNWISVKDPRLE